MGSHFESIKDSQHATWCRLIEAFDEGSARYRQLALFPAERSVPDQAQGFGVQVRLEASRANGRLSSL
jgi:hypothetical protein